MQTSYPRFSVIGAFFPELDENKQEDLLLRWVPSDKEPAAPTKAVPGGFYAPYLAEVLGKLDFEEDGKDFQSLKHQVDDIKRQEFVLSRVGMSRSKASHWTPKAIKRLKPPNSTLVWQVSVSAFQGYYPMPQSMVDDKIKTAKKTGKSKVKTMWSRHRGYLQKRSKLKALQEIVKWLWKTHKQYGDDSVSRSPKASFILRSFDSQCNCKFAPVS